MTAPATAIVRGSRIASATRVGIGVFGSEASVGCTALECNPIDLDAEPYRDEAPLLHNLGGNVCSCDGAAFPCRLVSAQLEPPTPLDPE